MNVVRCGGCGALLQSEEEGAPGYVPSDLGNRDDVLCRRCFRIRNYGEFSSYVVPFDVYETEVARALKGRGLILYVLDVFDLVGSLVRGLGGLVQGKSVIAIVNKVDLLPREVRPQALEAWVKRELEQSGVRVDRVLFTSGKSAEGIPEVLEILEDSPHDTAFVVGMANVGKSTLLNRMLMGLMDGDRDRFTVSRVPGTTIGLSSAVGTFASGKSISLVDTPGLIRGTRVTDHLCPDCLKTVIPSSRMRPRVFQLNSGQSLWIGGLARLDFIKGPHQSVVCYVSNDIVIHRTKLDHADDFGVRHMEDILKVPCPTCQAKVGALVKHPVSSGRNGHRSAPSASTIQCSSRGCDIVLPGLGWISLSGEDFTGIVHTTFDAPPSSRQRLIGALSRPSRTASMRRRPW